MQSIKNMSVFGILSLILSEIHYHAKNCKNNEVDI